MNQQEIPFDQWPQFLEQFDRLHQGKDAQVVLIDPATQRRHYLNREPLLGFLNEKHGSGQEAIAVMLGTPSVGTSSHTVMKPNRILASEWNDGYSAELEISSKDGQMLIVQVGPAMQTLASGVVMDGIQLEEP